MPTYYLDASAAVKGYARESGSSRVLQLLDPTEGHELFLSRVGSVEIAAAIIGRARSGETGEGEARDAVERLREDLGDLYRVMEFEATTAEMAVEVAEKHRLRAYDCVQLATALTLHRQREALELQPLTLLSSDRELNDAARDEGLIVEDPAESEGSQAPGADDADQEQETQHGGDDEAGEAEDADA